MRSHLTVALLSYIVAANNNDLCNDEVVTPTVTCDWACHETAITNYRGQITRYETNIADINTCVSTGAAEFSRLFLLEKPGATVPAWD